MLFDPYGTNCKKNVFPWGGWIEGNPVLETNSTISRKVFLQNHLGILANHAFPRAVAWDTNFGRRGRQCQNETAIPESLGAFGFGVGCMLHPKKMGSSLQGKNLRF